MLRQTANDVTAYAVNDVMLRINEVALHANGTEHLSHIGATILRPNTKVLDLRGFSCFCDIFELSLTTVLPTIRREGDWLLAPLNRIDIGILLCYNNPKGRDNYENCDNYR